MMLPAQVHIINHTHWDREWFLTSVYTSRWIPGLMARLEALVAANPDYRYLLDGQTLVIEDLLALEPGFTGRVQTLIHNGNLLIGPYYCQPDWQLSGGELLVRNLLAGRADMERLGTTTDTGWLVDTFGHTSQTPQLHRLAGLRAVYVWRGVPRLEPYFVWQGADGSELFTVNLFGGYRNLYGLTHAPEVALRRLQAEVQRLRPYYPTADIPLFDGYDLEDNPEDPLRLLQGLGVGPEMVVREETPAGYMAHIQQQRLPLPTLHSELNAGKYGAVFPGTASTRTYLKVLARDGERLLFQVGEPLAALAHRPVSSQYDTWARLLLQNAVHDCICGVSIDQVHEKMEVSYRQVFEAVQEDVQQSLDRLLRDFAPGRYAVSTNPFPVDGWQVVGDVVWRVQTAGVGVWPVSEQVPVETVDREADGFHWQNEHYQAMLDAEGVLHVGGAQSGRLAVYAEEGDAYSQESGPLLGWLRPETPLIVEQQGGQYGRVRFQAAWQGEGRQVWATVWLHFDPSPLVRWQIELDSRGTDLRVEMVFATGRQGPIFAGMPFDVVQRPAVDDDLLPRELPPDLAAVLLGQRELGEVRTFPFHDFVAVGDTAGTVAILAQGIRAYHTGPAGEIRLVLRRAVEWLTRANLRDRVGDAGPFFYVPDARCERTVQHEVAVGSFAPDSMALQRLNAAYQNPPLLVEVAGGGTETVRPVLQEVLPLSALYGDRVLARFYNPTPRPVMLSRPYPRTDWWGQAQGDVREVQPKEIVTVQVDVPVPGDGVAARPVRLLNPPPWRVGQNQSRPDPAVLAQMAQQIEALSARVAAAEAEVAAATGAARLRAQHQLYIWQREQLELQLSHLLNERKLAAGGVSSAEELYRPDPDIAALGLALNRLRIKRRIYDYVVQVGEDADNADNADEPD